MPWCICIITDAHAPASLLKLWYRELYEPLIPDTLYAECVADPDNTDNAFDIIQRLPRINRLVSIGCLLLLFSTLPQAKIGIPGLVNRRSDWHPGASP